MVLIYTIGFNLLIDESGDGIMAYSETYDAADLDNIVIDFIAQYAVQLIAFVALIALVTLAVWFKMKTNKLK